MRGHRGREFLQILCVLAALSACGDANDSTLDDLGSGYAYGEETLARFLTQVNGEDWVLCSPPRNAQGMLVARHEWTGLRFVLVPPGAFEMGPPEERRPVTIRRGFLLCESECTQMAWDRVGGNDKRKWRDAWLPIEAVSWEDAQTWLRKAGGGLRLPSEAEWEYACRAGTQTRYSFGDDEAELGDHAWFKENSSGRAHWVRLKAPNPWGLFDMHGNVWELCQDWFSWTDDPPADGSARTVQGDSDSRIRRGGSWNGGVGGGHSSTSSFPVSPAARFLNFGFRPAADLPD